MSCKKKAESSVILYYADIVASTSKSSVSNNIKKHNIKTTLIPCL